jgi:hypothetical protein
VTAISPTLGPDAGGTKVTITGTNFAAGATVTIGGVAATGIQVVSATSITATTGAGAGATADVIVTVAGQSGRLTGGYTYQAAVDALLTFTIYNHTAGPMGTFTRTARSGTDVTLQIANLGAQPAINVSGVDPQRIVIREAAQGGRIGTFVAFWNQGAVTIKAPYTDRASYDVFLMKSGGGINYVKIDNNTNPVISGAGSLFFPRSFTAFIQNFDLVGSEATVDELLRQFNAAINPSGMSYGSVNRNSTGTLRIGFATTYPSGIPAPGGAHEYSSSPTIWINSVVCASVGRNVLGVLVEELFEELTKTNDIDGTEVGGNPGSSTVRVNDNALSEAGRAYLAYVYVKDPKGW